VISVDEQLDRELTGADFSGPEEATQVIPVISEAERSGRWRAARSLDDKQLRSAGTDEAATQPLPKVR